MSNTTIEISKDTIGILKNFATINQSVIVQEGQEQVVLANSKVIMAKTKFEESFPMEFGIYDLPQFLSCMELFEVPILVFNDNQAVTITGKSDTRKITYHFSDTEIIEFPASTSPKLDGEFIDIVITRKNLGDILKASSVLSLTEVVISPSETKGKVKVEAVNSENDLSNNYEIECDANIPEDFGDFKFIFELDNMLFLAGDYKVEIYKNLRSYWKGADVEYWCALSIDSFVDGE